MIEKIKNFVKEVTVEMGKVSWPTRDELIGSTAVVIASTIIMAIFIGICDLLFSRAVHIVLK
jgi:preprotein translocase subunit SecE